MYVYSDSTNRGLGALTPVQGASIGGAAAGSILGSVLGRPQSTASAALSTAGGSLLAIAPMTGPAAPFVAVGGAIVSFLGSMGIGSGCGQKCVLSTQYANQAESLLKQNIAIYFAQPVPRAASAQAAALQNFDLIWNDLEQQCSNPSLGDPGARCISDRQAGACKWKATLPPSFPGQPQVGQCSNWFAYYRDPIANDADVVPDSLASSATSALSAIESGAGQALQAAGVSSSYALPALILLAVLLGVAVL